MNGTRGFWFFRKIFGNSLRRKLAVELILGARTKNMIPSYFLNGGDYSKFHRNTVVQHLKFVDSK